MERPDGITQEAWDSAIAIADVWQHPMYLDHQVMTQDIARAIQSAVEAENHACALEAMRWEDGVDAAEHIRRRLRKGA